MIMILPLPPEIALPAIAVFLAVVFGAVIIDIKKKGR
jgi:hypothetical protein